MADIVQIERALELVQLFHPIQRVLLTCAGTLQGTLSAWFGSPMKIHVIEQVQEGETVVHRKIEMLHFDQCVMRAESVITTSRPDVRDLLQESDLGIGQIMDELGIEPGFELLEVDQDSEEFWRIYELSGDDLIYRIKEVFPQFFYRRQP